MKKKTYFLLFTWIMHVYQHQYYISNQHQTLPPSTASFSLYLINMGYEKYQISIDSLQTSVFPRKWNILTFFFSPVSVIIICYHLKIVCPICISGSWAVFVVDDINVYFLCMFTFRYHFLPLYYHFSTCTSYLLIHTWSKVR